MEQTDRLPFKEPDAVDHRNHQIAPGRGSELTALAVTGAAPLHRKKRHRQPLPLPVEIL